MSKLQRRFLTRFSEKTVETPARPSNSPLEDLYRSHAFLAEWGRNPRLSVAEAVSRLRRWRGLTQDSLAELLGTGQSRISKIESAQENLSLDRLEDIARSLAASLHIELWPEEVRRPLSLTWWQYLDHIGTEVEGTVSVVGTAILRGSSLEQDEHSSFVISYPPQAHAASELESRTTELENVT